MKWPARRFFCSPEFCWRMIQSILVHEEPTPRERESTIQEGHNCFQRLLSRISSEQSWPARLVNLLNTCNGQSNSIQVTIPRTEHSLRYSICSETSNQWNAKRTL